MFHLSSPVLGHFYLNFRDPQILYKNCADFANCFTWFHKHFCNASWHWANNIGCSITCTCAHIILGNQILWFDELKATENVKKQIQLNFSFGPNSLPERKYLTNHFIFRKCAGFVVQFLQQKMTWLNMKELILEKNLLLVINVRFGLQQLEL